MRKVYIIVLWFTATKQWYNKKNDNNNNPSIKKQESCKQIELDIVDTETPNDDYCDYDIDIDIDDLKNKLTLTEKKKTKITRQLNCRKIIWNILTCNCQKLNQARKIFLKAEKKFNEHMYIKSYIDKMREVECLKQFIFTKEEEAIFTYGIKPIFKKKRNSVYPTIMEEEEIQNKMHDNLHLYCSKEKKNDKLVRLVEEYIELTK